MEINLNSRFLVQKMLVTGNINYDFILGELSIFVATNGSKKQKRNQKQTRVHTMVKREPTDEKNKRETKKKGKRYKGKMEESKRKWKKKEFRRQTSLGRCRCERPPVFLSLEP